MLFCYLTAWLNELVPVLREQIGSTLSGSQTFAFLVLASCCSFSYGFLFNGYAAMKTMRRRNDDTPGLSVIWDEADHTLEIKLSSAEKADVAILINDANRRIFFASGWSVHEGINEHTFDNVFFFATGRLFIQVRNADTNEQLFKSVLDIPTPQKREY